MALIPIKNKKKWQLCIVIGAILGVAWWFWGSYGGFADDVRQPVLEVNENKNINFSENKKKMQRIFEYTVQPGDTLSEIAASHNIDVATLLGANDEVNDTIKPGDKLVILPSKGVLYTVEPGDSIWRIAHLFQVAEQDILQANNKDSEVITDGEKIFIPGAQRPSRSLNSQAVSRRSDTKFVLPATGEISSPFGWRWGRLHRGLDIADDEGTSIVAAMSGKVIHTGWISGYGKTVIIEHQRGYSTLYGHMSEILTDTGSRVKQGQVIGRMGSTGNSTGPHVHFEVLKNGDAINPLDVLR